jgi:hypothetical protein
VGDPKLIAAVPPLHTVWSDKETAADGLTVMVNEYGIPEQVTPPLV